MTLAEMEAELRGVQEEVRRRRNVGAGSSGLLPAGCKFHSVGRKPDANFIQSAAIRMQISFSRPPAGCKLQIASG